LGAAREPLLVIVLVVVIFIQVNLLGGKLGSILIMLIFFYRALTAVTTLQTAWNKYVSVIGAFENSKSLQKHFDKSQEIKKTDIISEYPMKLSLNEVQFYFDKKRVLKDINLEIEPYQTIAFVGESGSGKTTLVNILSGLLPIDKGTFKIGSKDASQVNIDSYQSKIGYIAQEPVIFNDSVYNNVTFWDDFNEKNLSRFKEVIQQASLSEVLNDFEDKEKTILGNNGINLSGGQKQRISIARELYKDIEILIMDEATSALDSETEKSIQNSIDTLKGKYTILIVAHRLSTVKNADKIVYMKKGQIISIGTFEELIHGQKEFRRMVELQEI